MNKRIIALVLALVIAVTALTGCNLQAKNSRVIGEKAVMTIGKGEYKDTVSIQEVFNAFSSYGFMYVYYYSIPVEQVVELLLDNILTNKLMTYSATENLPKVNNVSRLTKYTKYDVFLTPEEIKDLEVALNRDISNAIERDEVEHIKEDAEEKELELPKDEDVRTIPSDYSYITKTPVDFVGTETRAAAVKEYKKAIENNNGYSYKDFLNSALLSYKKDAVLTKYIKVLKEEITATDADVTNRFNEIVAQEKEKYALSDSAYKAKLNEIQNAKEFSGSNFVLYSPESGYGFALNLLLKFSPEQEAQLKESKDKYTAGTMTKEEYIAKREELLPQITVKDLRDSWLKKYGYNSDLFNDYAFDGVANPVLTDGVQNFDELGQFKFDSINATNYSINDFFNKMNGILGGVSVGNKDGFDMYKADPAKQEEFINLIWAYGEDPGAFNSKIGYMCYAKPEESSFVEEYANASTALAKEDVGSYTIVATDYGYHVLFLVAKFDKVGINNEYIPGEKNVEGTFSYDFYKSVNEDLQNSHYNDKVTAIGTKYMETKGFVKTIKANRTQLMNSLMAALG